MEETLWRSFNDATMHLKTGVEFCREKAGSPLGVFKAGSINPKLVVRVYSRLVFIMFHDVTWSVRRLPLRA